MRNPLLSLSLLLFLIISTSMPSATRGQDDPPYLCGDVDGSGLIDISDLVLVSQFIGNGEPPTWPLLSGNADGCYPVNVSDGLYLMRFIFFAGPEPAGCEGTTDCRLVIPGNRVRVGCPVIKRVIDGDSIEIPIYMTNTVDLMAFTLGFGYSSADVRITSVSRGSGVPQDWYLEWRSVPGESRVLITGLADSPCFSPPLAPGTDIAVASLWMTVPMTTDAQCVDIDSTFVAPAGDFLLSQNCSSGLPSGASIIPEYLDCGKEDIIIGDTICPPTPACGDFDGDGTVKTADAVFLVWYIFAGGPVPTDPSGGDVNCDDLVNIADAVYMIAYIFIAGPAPCAVCG